MKHTFADAKRAAESLFWDRCRIEGLCEEQTDWGETRHKLQPAAEDFPCRLSERSRACGQNGLLAEAEQEAELFYPTERQIPGGSTVLISRKNGEERRYIAAGESRAFLTHKSCRLKRREII